MKINDPDGENIIYINERLRNKIDKIPLYDITVIDAPAGYGKTEAASFFSKEHKDEVRTISVLSSSTEIFFYDLCDALGQYDSGASVLLKSIGFPKNDGHIAKIREIIKNIRVQDELYIVIDNYHLVSCDEFNTLISSLAGNMNNKIHFIMIMSYIDSQIVRNGVESGNILYIGKEYFAFTQDDICEYYRLNGSDINEEESNAIYGLTKGFVTSIELSLLQQKVDIKDKIIKNILWDRLSDKTKERLMLLFIIDSVSIKEIMDFKISLMTEKELLLFMNTSYFIEYDTGKCRYCIRDIFKDFLKEVITDTEKESKRGILEKAGAVFIKRDDFFAAYKCFYEIDEWEKIYGSKPEFHKIYPVLKAENKDFFMKIIKECPTEARKKNYYFTTLMCLVLFFYNERNYLIQYPMEIVYDIEEDNDLNDMDKANYLGNLYFVKGYTEFNNIEIMNGFYRQALDYSYFPVNGVTSKIPFNFSCPSILHLYHTEEEKADEELTKLVECMPYYYELSGGHGKGADALMKAEILFNRGEFDAAAILCHKSLYMSDSREQYSISVGAKLLLTRICLNNGKYDDFKQNYDSLSVKNMDFNGLDHEYIVLSELAKGFVDITTDNAKSVSKWLTDWETVENNVNIMCMSYADIIYGKWLLLTEQYTRFLGISGELLGVASIFSNEMPKIYLYIYIAIANNMLGNKDKAVRILGTALDIALANSFVIPFVENYTHISEIVTSYGMDMKYRDFVKKIAGVAAKYGAGVRSILKNAKNKDNFGLTARELEVAKLAAGRLSNKEIAGELFIAESTVKSTMKTIFNKLDINKRQDLMNFFKEK